MTKVLVTDRSDDTYFFAVVESAGYDRDESFLGMSFCDGQILIEISYFDAKTILRDLFDRSVVDLTRYKARIVWN